MKIPIDRIQTNINSFSLDGNSDTIKAVIRSALNAGSVQTFEDLLRLVPVNLLSGWLEKPECEVELFLKEHRRMTLREVERVQELCGLTRTEIKRILFGKE